MSTHPEAPRRGLTHAAGHFLGEILRIELVDALDDGFHEFAGWRVVCMLRDGDDADASPAQHRLECDSVFPLTGESRELPDENFFERRVRRARLIEHLAELGPVSDASTFRLIDIFTGDEIAVLLRVVPQSPQLRGDGQINILPVT
ncbi:MAG: hypothetical protein OXC55_02230 [Chloroflexi bacterium]|nr:hypothetical protein [Chloroflexota bacterium]